ncbi:MAG: universal stress protein [Pyrinomonadaceae bacterium]
MEGKMNVLIAYDGSDYADAALDDLERAGLPRDTKAVVMSVAEVWLPPPARTGEAETVGVANNELTSGLQRVRTETSRILEAAQALASQAGERLRRTFPSWDVQLEAASGSPAWEVISFADQWQPDLVIVGAQGRSPIGRLVLGSVSQKILTEVRRSVRIARGRARHSNTPVRIVIGADGSAGAYDAVRAVARRPWPPQTEARIMVVDDPLLPTAIDRFIPPITRWIEEGRREERAWAEEILQNAAAILKNTEIATSTRVVEGDPKRALVEEAEEWGADVIFVGSAGFSNSLQRFLIGSVSSAVAARALCSVEVIR